MSAVVPQLGRIYPNPRQTERASRQIDAQALPADLRAKLLPRVRELDKTLVVADGFSCHEQLSQTTDRRALHLAQVLQLAHRRAGDRAPTAYPESASYKNAGRRFQPKPVNRPAWRIGGALVLGAAAAWAVGGAKSNSRRNSI
jgi:hypothetical protein